MLAKASRSNSQIAESIPPTDIKPAERCFTMSSLDVIVVTTDEVNKATKTPRLGKNDASGNVQSRNR